MIQCPSVDEWILKNHNRPIYSEYYSEQSTDKHNNNNDFPMHHDA